MVYGLWPMVQDLGLRVEDLGIRDEDLGCRVLTRWGSSSAPVGVKG